MNKGLSTYLDLTRLTAAALVFGHHSLLSTGCYDRPDDVCRVGATLIPFHFGHCAVVVFFVLSGYVITYVAAEREATLTAFAASRFARIYSVAIPAIILTVCVDTLLMSIGYDKGIPTYQYHNVWKYLPLFLTFTTDFWFLAESTFSDGVFWSLCYEVWYYILFASICYFSGGKRWALAALILLLVGIKLWALLPIWVLGSLVYRLHDKYTLKTAPARVVFFASAALIVMLFYTITPTNPIDVFVDRVSGGWVTTNMRFSHWFVSDTLVALVVATNIYAAKYACLEFGRLAPVIKVLASFTFTLYLVHGPLLEFWLFYVKASYLTAFVAVVASVALIGIVTEHQNHRLRRMLLNGWQKA